MSSHASTTPVHVSCLCPTRGRGALLAKAIAYFKNQTWFDRSELIIIENVLGNDSGSHPCSSDPSLHLAYDRVESALPLPLGAMRNRCARIAAGEFFVLWDDDDWYNPERIEAQITPLLDDPVKQICVLDYVTVVDEQGNTWRQPEGPSFFFPGTAAMRRSVWQTRPWNDQIDIGADKEMLRPWRTKAQQVCIDGYDLYRVHRHGQVRTNLDLSVWRPIA